MGFLQAALLISQLPNVAEGFQAPPDPHHSELARLHYFLPPWPVSIPACAMSPFPSSAPSSWPSGLHPAPLITTQGCPGGTGMNVYSPSLLLQCGHVVLTAPVTTPPPPRMHV